MFFATPRPFPRRSKPASAGTTPARSHSFALTRLKCEHRHSFPTFCRPALDTIRFGRGIGAEAPSGTFFRRSLGKRWGSPCRFADDPGFSAIHGFKALIVF